MRTLTIILLMLYFVLPGAGWAGVVGAAAACSQGSGQCCKAGEEAEPHCACCDKGACHCLIPTKEFPAKPQPALPARPNPVGDTFFFEFPQPVGLLDQPVECGPRRTLPPRSGTALNDPAVPLYIRHCAQLW